ncbi:helix-turn-helix domain-containing protein [Acidovorax sp.]|jgi:DNA-binding XRE family transcriptional regulator|uniref:helix-turn-helix transcriptional regulator n=1 Tax=Acidovorax sp. TaxID=1872122 RepID=UPI0025B84CB4|nr:helix-turn-helix domain-containing protein [Acidovorax sp.]MCI5070279.1 helix-turn-helix domain-containing protein [Acidovorax sp.]
MPKQVTPPADYPHAVLQQIELLGQHIAIARKRRGETQAEWARRLGVSQPTMARIERGDPSVAMASYVMCMWLVNPAVAVADLVAPQSDSAALEREIFRVRQGKKRIRKPADRSRATSSKGSNSPEHRLTRSNAMHALAKSAATEKPEIGVPEQRDEVLPRIEKALARRVPASSVGELTKLGALGSHEDELEQLKKSLSAGASSISAGELKKLGALGSYEGEVEKLKKSLAGGSAAAGLAALMLKRRTGLQ